MYRKPLKKYKEKPDYAFKSIHKYAVPGMKEAAELVKINQYLYLMSKWQLKAATMGNGHRLNSCFGCGVCIIMYQKIIFQLLVNVKRCVGEKCTGLVPLLFRGC